VSKDDAVVPRSGRQSQTGQILCERFDLLISQVLYRGSHHVAGARAIAKILQLLDDVGILLAGNARKFIQTLEIRLMTGAALRLGGELLSLLDDAGIRLSGTAHQSLGRKIFGQVLHVLIRQYDDRRRHHRVLACAFLEGLDLTIQVFAGLACEAWVRAAGGVAVGTVAVGAGV
jgi:hypothetical protein